MSLLGVSSSKKSSKNIKLDDYIENKISDLKKLVKENKTLITCTLLGSIYFFIKTYFLV